MREQTATAARPCARRPTRPPWIAAARVLPGDMGTVLHYDGNGWQVLPSGTTKNLNNVFMNANNTAWIVGGDGTQAAGSSVLLH